ncbi:uracil-DNA glycosylase [Curtobacterium herbarum]|uniref:Uracil-DNA glycosylase-like domain-containing protein n=1 Tax=Curtobacterium herbarum TaxID=150122 RepID=A0ABN1ZHC8_9MICO|nr:uracil-DNA glycosylase [Curtobacterium herbarum]MBM7475879.1 hypothetical protein [Curtobacterium herbarum]MCS6543789.1 uracil-DNA glycosylase [Curtobacterium herbarum]
MFLDAPRGFRDPAVLATRNDMLATAERTLPLEAWARSVEETRRSQKPDIVLPHFDPAEAGVEARALVLLEAPGPKTVPGWGGSGFISVDNDDPTAQNVWTTRNAVGLHEHVLAWNIVPWVLGRASVKPTGQEIEQGAGELRGLLDLLPELRVIVLAGRKAQDGWDTHLDLELGGQFRVLRTVHPAGQSFAQVGARERFKATLNKVVELVR